MTFSDVLSKNFRSGSSSSGSGRNPSKSGNDPNKASGSAGQGGASFPMGDSSSSGTEPRSSRLDTRHGTAQTCGRPARSRVGRVGVTDESTADGPSTGDAEVPSGGADNTSGRSGESTSSDFNFNGVPGLDNDSSDSVAQTSTEHQTEPVENEEIGWVAQRSCGCYGFVLL